LTRRFARTRRFRFIRLQRARWLAQIAWERHDDDGPQMESRYTNQVARVAVPYSLNLANQAALEWQAGRQQDAIATMTSAHAQAPTR